MRRRSWGWAGPFIATALGGAAEAGEPERAPVMISIGYTADLWRNAAGGLRVANAYLDKTELAVTLDGESALGWPGLTLQLAAFHTNRAQLSGPLVGDRHTVSNIDAPEVTALQEASIQQDLGPVSLKAGVLDLNTMFDVNEVGGLFVNSAHGIGPDFSQAGKNGPSIFPMPGLAASGEVRAGEWILRAGAFDGFPGRRGASLRQGFGLGRREGALYVAEIERASADGARLLIGRWRHTGVAEPDMGFRAGRGEGAYILVQPPRGSWRGRDFRTFVRVGAADGADYAVSRYIGAGVALEGSGRRARDELGLALAATDFAAAQHRHVDGARREISLEVTYRAEITPWLAVQPNLQWVSRPGGALDDALVVGLRLDFDWSG